MDPPEPVPALSDHLVLSEAPPEAIEALVAAAGAGTDSPLLSVEPPDVYRRLQEVRAQYDPGDLFCANHPVPAPRAPPRAKPMVGSPRSSGSDLLVLQQIPANLCGRAK